ncbi:hypothetical protein P43SY_006412 [Pythium insidiosum]|uniref:CW-type domain-containing protein n=1 Tax=Pythium insidiosum TaxID=114742 RepID=A0AAD5M8E2_PYTIN|nr:hypothetical protein P43SY_006412 [Pythium insidiosum]
MWSLRVRGPKGKAAVVQIAPDASMTQLCETAAPLLALRGKKNLSFRAGFPPKVIEYESSDLVRTKFANNDTIVVDVATVAAQQRAAAASSSSAASAAGSMKRSAAKRAAASTAPAAQRPAKRGVHTLHPAAAATRVKRSERGSGVRLGSSLEAADDMSQDEAPSGDAAAAAAAAAGGGRKYRRTRAIHLTSQEDVAVQLVQAVGGGSNDRAAKFFRAATRSAVEHQYALTLATARLNAALGRHFEMQELTTSTTASDSAAAVEMRVRFKEGVRKWKEEVVEVLQPLELQAILKYVLLSGGDTGREMLKPFNMAQCSPRVFWNIARLYNGDVAAGLAALCPDEDFSYVDTRSRQLSKKAMEAQANEAAYKQWKRSGSTAPDATPLAPTRRSSSSARAQQDVIEVLSDDEQAAQDAKPTRVDDQRHAEQRALRDAMAHAAMARFHVSARAEDVRSVVQQQAASRRAEIAVADEDDEDVEPTTTVYCDSCNKARILSMAEAAQAQVETADPWTCSQLAGIEGKDGSCAALDDEVEQIAGRKLGLLLLATAQVATRRDLANASLPATLKQLTHPLDATYEALKAKLTAVIDEARLDEVNDAMLEIVGGDEALVGTLELQKLGTPADLVETPADLIVQALRACVSGGEREIALEDVERWQREAKLRLDRVPWMGEWRTI